MSSYEELIRQIESLHPNLFVEDIGERSIDILYYGLETYDLLYEIDDILSNYDKNNILFNIKVIEPTKKDNNIQLLLSYKVNIGEDIESEEEMYQKSKDQRAEDIQDDNAMRAKDMRL